MGDDAMTDTRTGRCLCGAVRIEADLKDHAYGACHCSICRRWSGGAPTLALEATVRVLEGEERIVAYRSSDWAERTFCSVCGTNLWYRVTSSDPGEVALGVGALDDGDGLTLGSEIFIDEKPAGYAFAGDRQRMTGAEVMAIYPPPQAGGKTD
jgi:hypothetical protein